MSGQLRIDTLYAFIATNEDGEGVMGMMTGDGWLPLVGADLDRVASLRPFAEATARASGRTVTLAHFQQRVDVEVIT